MGLPIMGTSSRPARAVVPPGVNVPCAKQNERSFFMTPYPPLLNPYSVASQVAGNADAYSVLESAVRLNHAVVVPLFGEYQGEMVTERSRFSPRGTSRRTCKLFADATRLQEGEGNQALPPHLVNLA